ncbi:MAG TPA: antibiotic biosynthesis monooxygenase family protein [Dehalococcoidia bacterium]|nr:antibiotic biosynthesis monooxygenase family protein [Dehalococcoidia bacterium]
MNLVQEMPQLFTLDRLEEALERLRVVTGMMREQPGFLSAEVLQNTAMPTTLLVLHAWRDLADWEKFSRSPEKAAFMAGRPEGLYVMAECGLNWRSQQAHGAREGGILRREVIRRDDATLRAGTGILGCQTFVYQDELPAFTSATLRLTRISDATAASDSDANALFDETYTSLFVVPSRQSASVDAAGA